MNDGACRNAIALLSLPLFLLLTACDVVNNAEAVKQETAMIKAETAKLKRENAEWRAAVLDLCAQAKRVGLSGLTAETAKTLWRECPKGYFN